MPPLLQGCAFVTAVALVMLLAACGPHQLYAGPPRPAAEVARVQSDSDLLGPSCYIQYVDGEEVLGVWERSYASDPVLELEPGERRLSVALKHGNLFTRAVSRQNCLIVLPAVAGHTYEVRCEVERLEWRAWARDVAGGVADVPCLFLPLNTPPP